MLLESVLVTHLTLAYLTEPTETLQAFALHIIRQPFCAAYLCLGHLGWRLCGDAGDLVEVMRRGWDSALSQALDTTNS